VRRIATVLAVVAVVVVAVARPVAAHPLGNFSVSHYGAIQVNVGTVELRYVLDLAEIPTFQELQDENVVADATQSATQAYAARKADALRAGLRLQFGQERVALERRGVEIIFPPGVAGLPTLKLGVRYRATLPSSAGAATLLYRDENYADRAGWKEVIVVPGEGVTLVESSVPQTDRSQALSDYPADLLDSPPQDLTAYATFTRDGAAIAAALPMWETAPSQLQANRQALGDTGLAALLLAGPVSLGVILGALGVAAGLGAFHALEPGHGKTMVAAYLVGSRGTAWHAIGLGLVVTGSHTAAVYALGVAILSASRYVVPERIYPWLAVATGATIAGLGLYLFVRRCTGGRAHGHDHHHPGHHHQGHDEHHGHDHHHDHDADVSLKQLVTLGVTGGIVPCPAALVVLLGAVSLGRTGFGLLLIVAFSLGLAAVLIVTGLLVVYARRLMARVHGEGRLITRWLPLTSAAVITLIGMAMTLRALQAVLPATGAAG
jgi:nickel/cobalt exporter